MSRSTISTFKLFENLILGESAWRDWRAFCRGMVWSAVIELALALVILGAWRWL